MEGGTERPAFCDKQTGTESPVAPINAVGRVLRLLSRTAVFRRSHRSDRFESNLCDCAVDRGRGQLPSSAVAFFLSGVPQCRVRQGGRVSLERDGMLLHPHWNPPCRSILVSGEF